MTDKILTNTMGAFYKEMADMETEDTINHALANMEQIRDEHYTKRILAIGVHDFARTDTNELRTLAMQARSLERRYAEKAALITAEVTRRQEKALGYFDAIPPYLRSAT